MLHRVGCRQAQARRAGEEYAREGSRGHDFMYAALAGDMRKMRKLVDGLSAAVAKTKFANEADFAVRTFLDFVDPRDIATAAYCAAQENRPNAVRLLHEWRADLDKPNKAEGATPAGIAAQFGHTAMVQLLYGLSADVHRARNGGGRPIHDAARKGHDKIVLLLISLRADIS